VRSIGVDCDGAVVFVSKSLSEPEPEPEAPVTEPIEPEKLAEDEATAHRKAFLEEMLDGLPHCRVPEFER
jgi:hypothetical protein